MASTQERELFLKGEARLARGDRSGAEQAFEAATAVDGRLNRAHFILATLYEQSGSYDRAISRYKTILQDTPDVLALNTLRMRLLFEKGLRRRHYRLLSRRMSFQRLSRKSRTRWAGSITFWQPR